MSVRLPEADLPIVTPRTLLEDDVEVRFRLSPGDRALVAAGETITVGTPLAERLRDPKLVERNVPDAMTVAPGVRWTPAEGSRDPAGELLFEWRGRWRMVTGEHAEPLESPVDGVVREVRAGVEIRVAPVGRALRGTVALGGPSRGRLELATGAEGELRPGGLDVGLAGTILVVGSRVDAETLTRARAMGVRGIVVAGLSSKERRDFLASEARQRAALHRLPGFGVLVLDGAVRRPIASPVMAIFGALAGRDVALVSDPPMLVFDPGNVELPSAPPDLVRIRGGALSGREGRFLGALGPRRFPGGVHLEAGRVRFSDGTSAAVPIGDLERFA
ncbi:MAG: hypothetical protein ACJ761_00545 [Chloroflexota bacterium]